MSSASATGSTATAPGCCASGRDAARAARSRAGVSGCACNRESPHRASKDADGRDKPGHHASGRFVLTLFHDLPAAVWLAAGGAVGLLLLAADDRVAGVFAAVAAVAGVVAAGRRDPVAVALVLALPRHRLAVRHVLQHLAGAGLVELVHVAADAAADEEADEHAADRRDRAALAFAEVAADEDAANSRASAAAPARSVVLVIVISRVRAGHIAPISTVRRVKEVTISGRRCRQFD